MGESADTETRGEDAETAAVSAIDFINTMKKIRADKMNQAHRSDRKAQTAAREILESFYTEYGGDPEELDLEKKFIGKKGGRDKTYRTVQAGIDDKAKYIRWNLENLKHGRTYISKLLSKKLHALYEETHENMEDEHALSKSISLLVNRNPLTLVPDSESTEVKELLATYGANVSTHDGETYMVEDLLYDGNGMVNGDGVNHHYNFKVTERNKNPNDSINLLVQLANGDASLLFRGAHDEMRATKGWTAGSHPATSWYVHSKNGLLEDDQTPLPIDHPSIMGMLRDAQRFLRKREPGSEDDESGYSVYDSDSGDDQGSSARAAPRRKKPNEVYDDKSALPKVQGGNKMLSVYTPLDAPRTIHSQFLLKGKLAQLVRDKKQLERNLKRPRRSDENKVTDRVELVLVATAISKAESELATING